MPTPPPANDGVTLVPTGQAGVGPGYSRKYLVAWFGQVREGKMVARSDGRIFITDHRWLTADLIREWEDQILAMNKVQGLLSCCVVNIICLEEGSADGVKELDQT